MFFQRQYKEESMTEISQKDLQIQTGRLQYESVEFPDLVWKNSIWMVSI